VVFPADEPGRLAPGPVLDGSSVRPEATEEAGDAVPFDDRARGKTATGFEVPGRVVDELGAGKRPAVQVTVNGHRFRSTVAVMGGRFLLPLNAQNRAAAGVAAGDEVTVDIELDTAPRVVEVPPDLAAALDAEPAARARFDGLSYSMQRRWGGLIPPRAPVLSRCDYP
jgi:hypothetical protein